MCLTCMFGPSVDDIDTGQGAEIFVSSAPEPGWLSDEPVGARITWTGCAGFVFEVGGTRVAFDPFVSNPGLLAAFTRPARPDADLVHRTFGRLDAIFVGHSHWDHAMDAACLAKAHPACVVYGSTTTAQLCRRQGVPAAQTAVVVDATPVQVGPFTIEPVASRHGVVPVASRIDVTELRGAGMPRSPFRWPRGDVFAYRLSFAGRTFFVLTSANFDDAAFARQQPVDAAIVCLAARQGTDRYFDRIGEQLRPRVLIPCHHDSFFRPVTSPPTPVPRLDWPGFLDECARLHARYDTRLVQLPRGVHVNI